MDSERHLLTRELRRVANSFGLLGALALLALVLDVGARPLTDRQGALLRLGDLLLIAYYLHLAAVAGRLCRSLGVRSAVVPLERGLGFGLGVLSVLAVAASACPGWVVWQSLLLPAVSILLKWFTVLSALRLAFVFRTGYLLPGSLRATPLSPPAMVVGTFALVIASGTVFLCLPLASPNAVAHHPLDALFTATSATCVTGLIVLDTPHDFTLFGQLLILALIHVGGLGIMTLSAFFGTLTAGRMSLSHRLVVHDTLVLTHHRDLGRTVRDILTFVLVVEAVGATLLTVAWWATGLRPGQAAWQGIFHSISAFNNAGFSLFSNSLVGFAHNPWINAIVCALIITGGIGFPVVVDLQRFLAERRAGRRPRLQLHSLMVLVTSGTLIAFGFVAILLLESRQSFADSPFTDRLWPSLFQSVTPRTAGFNTLPIAQLTLATQMVLVLLMFVGASPGSTGGGIKTTTLCVVASQTLAMLRGSSRVQLWRRAIPETVRHRAFAVTILYLTGVMLTTFLLCVTERRALHELLFETVSAFGTVGLTTGLTPHLSAAGRAIISLAMYVGRVGPLTLALSIRQRVREGLLSYPEEEVMVG